MRNTWFSLHLVCNSKRIFIKNRVEVGKDIDDTLELLNMVFGGIGVMNIMLGFVKR